VLPIGTSPIEPVGIRSLRQPQAREPRMEIIRIPMRVALPTGGMPSVFTDYAIPA
jgi:hypothetical protein